MRKTKKALATLLAVMTTASALCVPMMASADEIIQTTPTSSNAIVSATEKTNPIHRGTYYSPSGNSFIQVTEDTCLLYKVNCSSYTRVSGWASAFSIATKSTEDGNSSFTLSSGQWTYESGGVANIGSGSLLIFGDYSNGSITVAGITYTK